MSNTLKVNRGAAIGLPTLSQGEFGFTTDTYKLYIGDGTANHNVLVLNPSRGDLIVAQGATPAWNKLAVGANGRVLISDGIDAAWSASALGTMAYETATNYVPYTGANANVNLGAYALTTPSIIGGSAVGSNIIYKSTTGAGTPTGIAHQWTGGTDGATVIATALNNGNFGIGTTSPGIYKLNVAGTMISDSYYVNTGGIFNQIGGDMSFWVVNVGQAVTIQQNTGNVGIGTTLPGYKLEIGGLATNDGIYLNSPSGQPRLTFNAGGAAVNNKIWDFVPQVTGVLIGRILNDAQDTAETWLDVRRSGAAVGSVNFPSGNVGIGTTAPRTKLELGGDGAILATGTYASGWIEPNLGAGTRMIWYPRKGAFRAGTVDGTQWNDAGVGNYSTAFGYGTIASGYGSTAMGDATTASGGTSIAMGGAATASGNYSIAMGGAATASGVYSIAFGNVATASGISSTAIGSRTIASGTFSTAMGYYTTADSYISTAIGHYNVGGGSATTWVATDPLFEIGIGTSAIAKANALTILKNGNTTFTGSVTAPNFVSNVAIGTSPYATTSTTLNTNLNADLLDGNHASAFQTALTNPVTGTGTTGYVPKFTGASTIGDSHIYVNAYSMATGLSTTASGDFATAMGSSSTASGSNSVAMGSQTTASGNSSFSMGGLTTASGILSTAFGYVTKAESYLTTVLGRYNVGGGTADDWIATDPLFEIGMGTSSIAKANAFTVYKNGNASFTGTVTIPTPFTLGATSVSTTGTQFNYLNAATGTTGTTSTNLVFSTSPTLTTPTFTTSATVPLIIGGTAVGSNIIYKSTTGAGTPTGIAHQWTGGTNGGTTIATMLNDGKVGIGTTTPSRKLTIANAGGLSGNTQLLYLKQPDDYGYSFNIADGDTGVMMIKGVDNGVESDIMALNRSTGNVGIGTTSPQRKLTVYDGSASARIAVDGLAVNEPGYDWYSGGTFKWTMYRPSNSNDLRLFDSADRVTFQNGGNVGIGTTGPGEKLSVNGNLSVGATSSSGYRLFVSGDTYLAGTTNYIDGQTIFRTTGATEVARIASSGNVGIGTTAPQFKFESSSSNSGGIATAIRATNGAIAIGTPGQGVQITFANDSGWGTGNAAAIRSQITNTANGASNLSLHTYNGTSLLERVTILNDGNVGIGTTAPSELFHISKYASADDVTAFIENTGYGAGSNTRLLLSTKGTSGNPVQVAIVNQQVGTDAGNLVFQTINGSGTLTDMVTIQRENGNVGIGTTGPGKLLTVGSVGSAIDSDSNYNAVISTGLGILRSGANRGVLIHASDALGEFIQGYTSGTGANDLQIQPFGGDINLPGTGIWKSTGNVGIGTTSPVLKLDVKGNSADVATVGGVTTIEQIALFRPSNDVGGIRFGSDTATGGSYIWSAASGASLNFGTRTAPNNNVGMTILNSGNVGIGTTAPNAALELYSTTAGKTLLFTRNQDLGFGASLGVIDFRAATTTVASIIGAAGSTSEDAGLLLFYTKASAGSLKEQMRIDKDGNVGIGTTSPIDNLHILDAAGANLILNSNTNAVSNGIYMTEGATATANQNGAYVYYNGSSNTFNIATGSGVPTDKLTIERDTGNVGIGTTAPNGNLNIHQAAAGTKLSISSGINVVSSEYGRISFFSTALSGAYSDYGAEIRAYQTDGIDRSELAFFTSNSATAVERMRIDRSGNVGIGTTVPRANLDVKGSQNNVITSANAIGKFVGGDAGIHMGNLAGTPNYGAWLQAMRDSDDLVFPLLLNPLGGSVGIGTTAPNTKLDVQGGNINSGATYGYTLGVTGAIPNGVGGLYHTNGLTTGFGTLYSNLGGLQFNTEGAAAMTILKTSGNVGIGTTAPLSTFNIQNGIGGVMETWSTSLVDVAGRRNWGIGRESNSVGDWSLMVSSARGIAPDTYVMTALSTGNVGIGTTTPGNKLSVVSPYGSEDVLPALGSNGGKFSLLNGSGAGAYGLLGGTLGTGDAFFQVQRIDATATAYNLLLQPTAGNVGIGTTNPLKPLQIGEVGSIVNNPGIRIAEGVNGNYWDMYVTDDDSNLCYGYGGSDKFTILINGNVGIGTMTPTSILHTIASGAKTATYIGNSLTNTATSSTASITKTGLSVESTGTWNGTTAINRGLYVNATGGTTNYSAVFDGGNVGIGYSSGTEIASNKLAVNGAIFANGNIAATGEITAYSSSDIRLKENISPLLNGLELNRKLNPVMFNWNDRAVSLNSAKNTTTKQYGNIAQDVFKTSPELVHDIYGNYLALDYTQMIPIHTAAINELDSEVGLLKKRIIELENELLNLKN